MNLNFNNISDIEAFGKSNFKNIKILGLYNNNISDIKIFEKIKFEKLVTLNLEYNTIDSANNSLKAKIKEFDIDKQKI